MGQLICKLPNGNYFLWSTVTDSPITYGCSLETLENMLRADFGEAYMRDEHPRRMERVEAHGTSCGLGKTSLAELTKHNRAGPNESCISLEEIIEIYGSDPDES